MPAFTGLTVSHLNFAGCFFRYVVSIGWEAVDADGFVDRRAHIRFRRPLMRLSVWPLRGPLCLARRVIMMKYAVAAVVCSASLTFCSDTLQARCGCRRSCASSCCTPVPTCCAPAASCAAPAAPAANAPAPPADAAPPAPSAGILYGDPAVAAAPRSGERQTYRSFSYDPATAPGAYGSPANTPVAPRSNRFDANRKMLGIRY